MKGWMWLIPALVAALWFGVRGWLRERALRKLLVEMEAADTELESRLEQAGDQYSDDIETIRRERKELRNEYDKKRRDLLLDAADDDDNVARHWRRVFGDGGLEGEGGDVTDKG